MTGRQLPPVGGGDPVLSASGIVRPKDVRATSGEAAPLTLTLTMSPAAEQAGRAVAALIRSACSGAVRARRN